VSPRFLDFNQPFSSGAQIMMTNNGMKTPHAFAEALKGQIVGPANDPANPEPVEPRQQQEPLRTITLTDSLKGTVIEDGTVRVAGDTVRLIESRAYDLCAAGYAIAVGALDWFKAPFRPKPKFVPVAPTDNLNEPGPGRTYKVKAIGSKGVFVNPTTFIGTLYLSESDARIYSECRTVELIEPKVLPPVREKTYRLQPTPNGASLLVPTA
jgi:hypothetical protein